MWLRITPVPSHIDAISAVNATDQVTASSVTSCFTQARNHINVSLVIKASQESRSYRIMNAVPTQTNTNVR